MVEQPAVNRRVVGSSPTFGANFIGQNAGLSESRTDSAQNPAESEAKAVKFPKVIRHRKAEVTIYGKKPHYPFYRVAYYDTARKRRMRHFTTYAEAKQEADKLVRELSQGSQNLALTNKEAISALAIRDALEAFRRDTGRNVTALQAVTGYLDAAKRLGARPLTEAVDAFLQTVAVVKPTDLVAAVEQFIAGRAPKAKAKEPGKRSALNPKYVENTAAWLREFSAAFPGHKVGDLSREHFATYISAFEELSAKSRNDRRTVVKQFLRWCVQHDYLSATHRLLEAEAFTPESYQAESIDYYRPAELRALLESAEGPMRAVIALQGLAGLRLEEALRLDWREVFTIPGHVEVSSAKSKTRQRRLVEIHPSLEQWLAPYRGMEGRVAAQWETLSGYVQAFIAHRESLKIPSRRNGLRHAFCTYHFALHKNENLTSALAGNSPAMIHGRYKGLATATEAQAWFDVAPAKADNVIPMAAAQKTGA
jgi:integrase